MGSQNIFAAQRSLESKMTAILQRISQLQAISCTSGQAPTIQVGVLAMDSASEPVQLDFTEKYTELLEPFRALRSRGPFLFNGATIKAYTDRFKSRPSNTVKVRCSHLEKMLPSKFKLTAFSHCIYCIYAFYICVLCGVPPI